MISIVAGRIRRALRPIMEFNEHGRDRWVADAARRVPAGSIVLDLGAGSAPYRGLFMHCSYISQDFVQLPGSELRGGAYAPIDIVSDATRVPLADASVDTVVCTEVLEHVPDPGAVVSEISRLLRPGGTLLLSAPLGSGLHQQPFHYYGGFTPEWYRLTFQSRDMEVVEITANGGSFRHFGQESVRFWRMLRPRGWQLSGRRLLASLAWLILWPVLIGIIPVLALAIDDLDHEQRFTVGYHVVGRKRPFPSETRPL